MLYKTMSAAVYGIDASIIEVEVDVSGIKIMEDRFHTVGLPDAAVRESRDRVRAALKNCGYDIPPTHITINLAPADIRKEGSGFDLPMALGILGAYTNREWEKLSITLNLLIPKLPAPKEDDLSKGILEAIDMDSYRVEKRAAAKIALADEDAEIAPVPVEGGGHKREPELDRLSNILKTFNDHFGTLFTDADRVAQRIRDDIAPKVAADPAYQNAKKNTPNAARIEHDKALAKVMLTLLKDDTQVYKQFVENESFQRFVTDMVFTITSSEPPAP